MTKLLSMPPEIIAEVYSWLRHPNDIINFSSTCTYLYDNRNQDLIKHIKLIKNVCDNINKIEYKTSLNNSSRRFSGWECEYTSLDMSFPIINCLNFKGIRKCSREKFESTAVQRSKKSHQDNVVFITGHSYYEEWASSRFSYGSIGTFAYNSNVGRVVYQP
jgi:hypothetical protein